MNKTILYSVKNIFELKQKFEIYEETKGRSGQLN